MERAPRPERTALVVDDDKFVVSALAELLEDDGFDVHTATNGFSGLRLAIECRPSVVLLDLALPERSGTEILVDLRGDAAIHDIAVVVVTGYPEALSEAHLAEVDGVVTKPFDAGDLLAAIQRAMHAAAGRRAEVAPVAATNHREPGTRPRRAAAVRGSHGRR